MDDNRHGCRHVTYGLVLGKVGQERQLARLVMLQRILLGLALFATFLSRDIVVVIALSVPAGIGLAGGIGVQTLLQSKTDEQYRGRVLGAFGTTVALLVVVGMGLGSFLAAPVGVRLMLNISSGLFVLAGALGLVLLPSVRTQELAATDRKAPDIGS